jgi:hypothetical protein
MNAPVRWTFARKIELLNEIRAGRLSPVEALVQFGIGPEELSRWQELSMLGGEAALMAGQAQKYRQKPASNNWVGLRRKLRAGSRSPATRFPTPPAPPDGATTGRPQGR